MLGRPGWGVGVNLYRFVFLPPSVVPHPDHYWFRGGCHRGWGLLVRDRLVDASRAIMNLIHDHALK